MQDKIDAGRYPKGEEIDTAKLTADAVRQIRQTYAAGGATLRDLARAYASPLSLSNGLPDGRRDDMLPLSVSSLRRNWRRSRLQI